MTSLPPSSLLSSSTVPSKPIKKTSEKSCFVDFHSALQRYTICPKKPEREKLSGAKLRSDDFVLLTEFARWLVDRSDRRSSPLEDLLREVYAEVDIAPHLNHVLDGDTSCLVTFCILLEIGRPELLGPFQHAQLLDRNLPITNRASLDYRIQQALKDAGSQDFFGEAEALAKAFNEKQWKYFPIQLSPVRQRWDAAHVLPFVDRQLITDKGGTSSIYQVAVPERFVADTIKTKAAHSMDSHPDFEDVGKCCNFALKVFEAGNIKIFEDEVKMYNMMTDTANNGMLTYLGNFTLVEGNSTTHTIILEYADSDLSEYFYRTSPVLPVQIVQFWRDLFSIAAALRDLHEFKISRFNDEHIYEGWHADIKSDNILLVDDQFKLADPGFAKFQRRKQEPDSPRTSHQFTGGTTTYGAPERHSFADKVSTDPRTSDMWSLGCVLSESATWVVLGRSGIRQFRDLRLNAVPTQSNQEECSYPPSNKRVIQKDSFHNGEQILSEVKEWHDFLRAARRPTDVLTDKILDLVDKHLLVANPHARFTAVRVCQWFEKCLDEVTLSINRPGAISVAVQNAISVALEKEAEELQDHLDSRSKIAREAAKVDPTYLQVPGFGTPSKVIPSRITVFADSNTQASSFGQRQLRNNQNATTLDRTNVGRPAIPATAVYAPNGRSIPQKRKSERYCIFHSHYTFMDKSLRNEQDEGDMKNLGIWNRLRSGPKSKDNRLAKHIKNRDLVFLVDNGATMDHFWYETVFVLETLYNKCRGSDDDGVDLFFTCGRECVTEAKDESGLKAFRSKVWHPAVRPNSQAETNMQRALTSRLNVWLQEYEQRMEEVRGHQRQRKHKGTLKDLTIIVLTDGIWPSHQENPTAVDDAIVSFNERFRKVSRESMDPRTVSIQFVSFGRDSAALERLRRLDDNLGQRGVPDIVDHEPANGDVYKMLAGSISELMDNIDEVEVENSTTLDPQTAATSIDLLPMRMHSSRASGHLHRRQGSEIRNTSQRLPSTSTQQTRDKHLSITTRLF